MESNARLVDLFPIAKKSCDEGIQVRLSPADRTRSCLKEYKQKAKIVAQAMKNECDLLNLENMTVKELLGIFKRILSSPRTGLQGNSR